MPALRGAPFRQQLRTHQRDQAQQLLTQARKQAISGLAYCMLIGGLVTRNLSGIPALMWTLVLIAWGLSIFINLKASAYLGQSRPRTVAGAVLAFIPLLTLIGLAFEFRALRKNVFR